MPAPCARRDRVADDPAPPPPAWPEVLCAPGLRQAVHACFDARSDLPVDLVDECSYDGVAVRWSGIVLDSGSGADVLRAHGRRVRGFGVPRDGCATGENVRLPGRCHPPTAGDLSVQWACGEESLSISDL